MGSIFGGIAQQIDAIRATTAHGMKQAAVYLGFVLIVVILIFVIVKDE